MMYAGKELGRDGCELWKYGVHNKATLELLRRLRGGIPANGNDDVTKTVQATIVVARDSC